MTVTTEAAVRRICARGSWRVTNLALQKILYLAHMVHMGTEDGKRLVNARFEAWDYGPVQPDLYHQVKIFGDQPICDIFWGSPTLDNRPEGKFIDEACDFLLKKSAGELVAMTHWKDGAWAKHYRPGARGIVIPDIDIIQEYRDRTKS